MQEVEVDVLVIGAGNAGLCAALSAREAGATVAVLECAPRNERGGNTTFTAGAMRVVYEGLEDLRLLVPDLGEADLRQADFGAYTADQFFTDMAEVTEYRANPDLVELLVQQSFETLRWMQKQGVRFMPIFGRQAFKVEGKYKFWGGLTVEVSGGGPGLVEFLMRAVDDQQIRVHYNTRAVELIRTDKGVEGVVARANGKLVRIPARSVILASGGFEANSEWRTRYLGPGWELAKVRGSRFNTGDGIRMALEIGASSSGNWSGCHAVAWDMNAPEFGDLAVGDGFQKHSYPFGIMVNAEGKRFVDEGADFRNYTYAKYGKAILQQPGHFAWQVFDQKVAFLLRDEYRIREVTGIEAKTIEDLARKMEGVDAEGFLETIRRYNAAVQEDVPFDPNVKDGRATNGVDVPKSNWANTIDEPPFRAYAVTCGITFTFGGLRISSSAEVIDTDGLPIPGLFAAGELVGDIFYFNYPGGTGLTAGAVLGRIAGAGAASIAQRGAAWIG